MNSTLPEYKVYAIRYGSRAGKRAEHFLGGDPRDEAMALDFYFWLVIGQDRTFVVDLGMTAESAAKRKRQLSCDIPATLTALGVDPENVSDVILTHLHYDHTGNHALFPKAQFHLQEAEMHFATGADVHFRFFANGFDVDDVVSLIRLNFAGRLSMYNGAQELAPGVEVEVLPGHSTALQIVKVHTKRGWVVLASDAAHYYEHLLRRRPHPAVVDARSMLRSFDRLLAIAPVENIVPGHDPLVMELYPAASAELAGTVARLDETPGPIPTFTRAKRS